MSHPSYPSEILTDILTAALQAQEFVAGMDFHDFRQSLKTQFAVVRALEIIGEATKRLPKAFREQNHQLPWRDMAGMRDKLIHGYTLVDYEVVWATVINDLPVIITVIRKLLTESD